MPRRLHVLSQTEDRSRHDPPRRLALGTRHASTEQAQAPWLGLRRRATAKVGRLVSNILREGVVYCRMMWDNTLRRTTGPTGEPPSIHPKGLDQEETPSWPRLRVQHPSTHPPARLEASPSTETTATRSASSAAFGSSPPSRRRPPSTRSASAPGARLASVETTASGTSTASTSTRPPSPGRRPASVPDAPGGSVVGTSWKSRRASPTSRATSSAPAATTAPTPTSSSG